MPQHDFSSCGLGTSRSSILPCWRFASLYSSSLAFPFLSYALSLLSFPFHPFAFVLAFYAPTCSFDESLSFPAAAMLPPTIHLTPPCKVESTYLPVHGLVQDEELLIVVDDPG